MGKNRAAIVSEVLDQDGLVYAHVFVSPSDIEQLVPTDDKTRVPFILASYSEQHAPGTWHWIEQEPS